MSIYARKSTGSSTDRRATPLRATRASSKRSVTRSPCASPSSYSPWVAAFVKRASQRWLLKRAVSEPRRSALVPLFPPISSSSSCTVPASLTADPQQSRESLLLVGQGPGVLVDTRGLGEESTLQPVGICLLSPAGCGRVEYKDVVGKVAGGAGRGGQGQQPSAQVPKEREEELANLQALGSSGGATLRSGTTSALISWPNIKLYNGFACTSASIEVARPLRALRVLVCPLELGLALTLPLLIDVVTLPLPCGIDALAAATNELSSGKGPYVLSGTKDGIAMRDIVTSCTAGYLCSTRSREDSLPDRSDYRNRAVERDYPADRQAPAPWQPPQERGDSSWERTLPLLFL